jgi:Zn-finger nucleic acid-binding protein
MRCPNDGARLVEIERSEILVDACPECRGVWLDGDPRGHVGA